jgi:hypothetical protein
MGKGGKLAAELSKLPDHRKGPRCGIAMACDQLSADDRAEFQSALADVAISSRMLSVAARNAFGINVQYAALIRHRGGHCQCRD